jgi:signal transduction histidine kinase
MASDAKAGQPAEKAVFFNALAHKLRNRLGVIQTAIYNIKQKAANPEIGPSIAKIERKIFESSQIIAGVVAFARIETPSYQATNIYDILEECLENARAFFSERDVTVSKKYQWIDGSRIDVDPQQMKEVFTNLLRNAYEAVAERKGEIEVYASLEGASGEMAVRIQDNGTGISADNLAKIGEPFFSTKSEGAGLGLTSCYKIVGLHGGRIEIESELERGTTVTVRLPVGRGRVCPAR